MGTWSIELPSSHPLASIDQTGKVTFQPHTEMISYTIKFTGTTAETKCEQTTLRGNIVVYPCTSTTMCTYSVTPTGDKVPSTASSTKVKVGRWTTGGTCSNLNWTFTNYEGEDFLTGFEVRADGFVYASITKDNPSSESRFAKYEAKATSSSGVKSSPSHFAVEQEGKGAPPVSECPNITATTVPTIKPQGAIGVAIVDFHTDKDKSDMRAVATSGSDWLTVNNAVAGRGTKYYQVMGNYTANNSGTIRYGEVTIYCGPLPSSILRVVSFVQYPNT